MKNHLFKFAFAFLLLFTKVSFAQTSQIMDARIDWTRSGGQCTGQLSVFLVDTVNLSGLKISIGSQADDSDLYQATYTTGSGGNFTGTVDGHMLQTSIGTLPSHSNYYARISVLLSNGKINQIAIRSPN